MRSYNDYVTEQPRYWPTCGPTVLVGSVVARRWCQGKDGPYEALTINSDDGRVPFEWHCWHPASKRALAGPAGQKAVVGTRVEIRYVSRVPARLGTPERSHYYVLRVIGRAIVKPNNDATPERMKEIAGRVQPYPDGPAVDPAADDRSQ